MAEIHANPTTDPPTIPTRAEHDAAKRRASTRPGRVDRDVPKRDPAAPPRVG